MFNLDKTHEMKINRMINIKNSGMAKTSKHGIKKMSIEVEGAFSKKPLKYDHDPSVSVESDYITNKEGVRSALHQYFGESKSLICANETTLREYVNELYEKFDLKFNSSCGLHIHIQLKSNDDYSKLMKMEFYSYFLDWLDWFCMTYQVNHGHRFYKRIAGKNHFAERRFNPDDQYNERSKGGDRYCFINYCFNCIRGFEGRAGSHKGRTAEFRVFCMFQDQKMTLHLLREFRKMVNAYLKNTDNSKLYISTKDQQNEYWERDHESENGHFHTVGSSNDQCAECENSYDDCTCNECGECGYNLDDCECERE